MRYENVSQPTTHVCSMVIIAAVVKSYNTLLLRGRVWVGESYHVVHLRLSVGRPEGCPLRMDREHPKVLGLGSPIQTIGGCALRLYMGLSRKIPTLNRKVGYLRCWSSLDVDGIPCWFRFFGAHAWDVISPATSISAGACDLRDVSNIAFEIFGIVADDSQFPPFQTPHPSQRFACCWFAGDQLPLGQRRAMAEPWSRARAPGAESNSPTATHPPTIRHACLIRQLQAA